MNPQEGESKKPKPDDSKRIIALSYYKIGQLPLYWRVQNLEHFSRSYLQSLIINVSLHAEHHRAIEEGGHLVLVRIEECGYDFQKC